MYRITPACAGNRPLTSTLHEMMRDHPRVCGEQIVSLSVGLICSGSPPRVRGTAFSGAVCAIHVRITPACAGNRRSELRTTGRQRDHPRVCGEQNYLYTKVSFVGGSPPRVRGTARVYDLFSICHGITPACAGNSDVLQLALDWFGDHPRVCGEQ